MRYIIAYRKYNITYSKTFLLALNGSSEISESKYVSRPECS
jgi:hypothetical protein